jgi:D-methionine transport system substrate-binding protein
MSISRRSFGLAGTLLLLGGTLPVVARADQTLRVGIMSGEDEDVWAVASEEAKKHGITVKLTTFNDYTQPNEALENGDVDGCQCLPAQALLRANLEDRVTAWEVLGHVAKGF